MTGRRFALLAALSFFVMFVAGNLNANSWFRTWRLDLTENHLYSLSSGTQHVLDGLSEPIQLTLYYSRDSVKSLPQLQAYGSRVREMLQTFQARSHGRVRFAEVNVKPFTEEEDAASEAGVEPRQLYEGADPLYFGLVGENAINDKRAIPFFDPQNEAFLEYQVTRLIYELENPEQKRVALISSLPLDPAEAQMRMQFGGPPSSTFAAELGRAMQVEKLPADFTEVPGDVDVLAIIHPPVLTAQQSYAIDQFIMRKGRAFIALDPASLVAQQSGFDPSNPMGGSAPPSSSLEPLLSRYGVQMSRDVVLDLYGAARVNTQDQNGQPTVAQQPLYIQVPAQQLDQHDLMTAWLQRGIIFGATGSLNTSERPGVTYTPLVRTSGNTMHVPAEAAAMIQQAPLEALRGWTPGGRIETLALRVSGRLQSAFPNGPPEGAAPAGGAAPLRASAGQVELVVVADTDFLADPFYIQGQTAVADNGSFALNAIDVLSGSDALVSLRSRSRADRPMELIARMESDARRRIEQEQQRLEGELQATEQQLAALQAQGHGSGILTGNLGAELTPQEQQEIERFRKQATDTRAKLRGVQRDLRSDINRLEALVVFLDMWLAPLLIAAAGIFLFWRRQRRGRARAAR
ncbi:MAG TPA: Gldg family protein [Caulobacterales bacterium]|nr:Gldg family protein [Caulobacterales bacterium]